MGSSPQATALPLKGLSSRQLQYPCSTQPGTPLERKKSECHRQDLEDWLRTSVTASYNVWLTFPVEEKQESEKGQGWCGGCVKPNLVKKLNFWFLYTWKKKSHQVLILLTIYGIFRYKEAMKCNKLSEGCFLSCPTWQRLCCLLQINKHCYFTVL